MTTLKRTPLFPVYAENGAKTVEFGGWDMPVQFSSILQEHQAVRERAGLFDVSHMGEFEVQGKDARAFLQHMVTNDVSKLEPGMAMYSPMVYPSGGTVDDLLLYCFSEEHFWVVVNAGNIDKDFAWFESHGDGYAVKLTDRSGDIALLALQGPRAEQILATLTDTDLGDIRYYRFVKGVVSGHEAVISRTGYTGEDGFELYVDKDAATTLWKRLLEAGADFNLVPCGLGCRDTLRLEARLPLYGHELTEDISPLEAGLGMFVKLDAGDFIGREVLAKQKAEGVSRKTVGIRLTEKGIPRAGHRVFSNGQDVGFITSGTMSPTSKDSIGLALVDASVAQIGNSVTVDIRGRLTQAEIVKTPFYKRVK